MGKIIWKQKYSFDNVILDESFADVFFFIGAAKDRTFIEHNSSSAAIS
jgi:hypothetical protein